MILQESLKSTRLFILCLAITFTFSCMQTEQYQGRYVASRHNAPDGEEISIELKENGHGNWMVGEEDVEIRWEIRKKQLVLHTKSGGVVIGELSGDKIEIKQADGGSLILEKVKQH